MKQCRVCKELKILSEFSQNPTKSDGLNSECRNCQKNYFKNHYSSKSQECINRVKESRKSKRYFLSEIKLASGCCLCGYKRNPAALHFHHSDPGLKKFSIGANYGLDPELLLEEISKCVIMCANCHIEHHNPWDLLESRRVGTRPTTKRGGTRIRDGKNKCNCGKDKTSYVARCVDCSITDRYPNREPYVVEDLRKLVWEMPTTKVAKIYGVSDKAVEKWCVKHGISKPPRGYWSKNKNCLRT